MCFVKNFHVGQFSGPTWGGSNHILFSPGRHPARSGLNSQSKKPAYVALKTFAQGSFYATYAGFNNHRNLNRYERTTSPFS